MKNSNDIYSQQNDFNLDSQGKFTISDKYFIAVIIFMAITLVAMLIWGIPAGLARDEAMEESKCAEYWEMRSGAFADED